ncbi:MAG: hypothetical protein ABIG56_05640 [Candidatus Omnitrophota bacterium]
MKKNLLFIGFILAFIILSFGTSEAINIIRVDQAKIRLSIAPGSTKAGSITIDNPTEQSKYIRAYLEDWYYLPSADGSKDFKPAGTTNLSCADWINFVPAEFTLPPFGRQVINYTVRVPQNAQGGRYAILFLEHTKAPGDSPVEGSGFGVAVRVGSLIYIEPEGTIERKAELLNPVIERESNDNDLIVSLDFQNTGNVDLTAGGSFDIIDKEGMVFARGEFNNVYTFPGEEAKFIGSWSLPLERGKYDLILTIDIGRALAETNMGKGPVIVKEAELEIGRKGEVVKVGDLK